MKNSTLNPLMILSLLTLAGCGGGGGYGGGKSPGGGTTPPESPPPTFTISVAVTGLDGEMVLQNNAADDLSVKANGTVPFTKQLNANATYEVTIKTLPAHQHCELTNAKGTIGTSNVTVAVACASNPVNSHTLSVSVTGLTGTLKLHDKSGANLTVTGNGLSSFLPPFQGGFEYAITITDQPAGQQCTLGPNSSGTVGDTDNIDAVIVGVTCGDLTKPSHLVSVDVSGLSAPIVLLNNGGDDLPVTADGLFAFTQSVREGDSYSVTFKTPPTGQTCEIPAPSDTMGSANVVVDVSCHADPAPTHTLSVAVSGLDSGGGNSVVLHNNNDPAVTLTASNPNSILGAFANGDAYAVTIDTHPSYPAADCAFVGSGAGAMGDSDIVLQINCTALPVISTFKADVEPFFAHTATVTWPLPPRAGTFNLYISTTPDCDFRTCGELMSNVQTGGVVTQFNGQPLKNGQLYFFQLESVFNTAIGGKLVRGLSNKAAARPNGLSFDEKVNAMTAAPNGIVYVGGSFSRVGVASGSLVALDRATGGLAPVQVPAVAGAVSAIIADGAGGWYLGGEFTHVGNVSRHNLAHVNADGSVDATFDHGTDGRVRALAIIGSTLYVGGEFNAIEPAAAGASPRNVAAINLSDGSLTNWSPNPNSAVRAIARLGGAVFIGGDFTNLHQRLSRFDIDGSGLPGSSTPSTLDLHVDDRVEVLTARDDSLYIGGSFTSVGGRTQSGVARVDLVGDLPTLSNDFRPDLTNSGASLLVKAIVVSDDASLVWIGGGFDELRGPLRRESRTNLAAVRASDGTVTSWSPNPNDVVSSLAAQGNTIYAGGYFNTVGAGASRAVRVGLAAVNLSTGEALELNPGVRTRTTIIDVVQSLVVAGDSLYMGGSFTHLGGVSRPSLAAVDAQGGLTGWNPATNAEVKALLFHNNPFFGPVVYAGGFFSLVNGRAHSRLVALSANTGDDIGAFEGTVNGAVVNAIAVLDSAGLYIGGDFASIGNPAVTSPNVAKLFFNDGTINAGFRPNANGPVNALVATSDIFLGADVVYIGGDFSDLRAAAHLAKVDGDSGLPIMQDPGHLQVGGTDRAVDALALEDDGTALYVGGRFNTFSQRAGPVATPGGLTRIRTGDGIVDVGGFDPAPNTGTNDGRPQAIKTLDGFTVMAGGGFSAIGGQSIGNFAVLDHLFTRGSAITRYVFPNGPVRAIAVSGNRIYLGGRFSGCNAPANGGSSAGVCSNFAVIDATTGALVQ